MLFKNIWRGLIIAAVVSGILTIINQYEGVVGGDSFNLLKLILTFCILFFVYLAIAVASNAGAREQQFKALQALHKLGMTVHDNAKNVNQASTDRLEVAKGTIEAAEKVMQCSNSIDELSESNVQRVARLAQETDKVLNEMASLIENLRSTLSWASDLSLKFDELEKNFANLYKMADVIESLASQTKLLSINAAVEAANAGEAGRGFAIVASRVKELAGQSDRQSKNIAESLNTMRGGVRDIQRETAGFTKNLGASLLFVSKGEDDSRKLREHMNTILKDVSGSIDYVSRETSRLRTEMLKTRDGMHVLVEGTEAVVTGSSNNIRIGVAISDGITDLRSIM